MRVFLIGILFCLFLLGSCIQENANHEKIIGVKIYDHQGDLNELFGSLESAGINTLFVSPELARKQGFITLAKERSMPVFLIVPTFYNPDVLHQDSSLYAITAEGNIAIDDWVEFICPNRKNYKRNHLEYLKSLVEELSPNGISIDFIRYFVFWEKVYPDHSILDLPQTCFDDTCLTTFTAKYDIRYPENVDNRKEKVNYILEQLDLEWTDFKVNTITSYVQEITQTLNKIDPSLRFNLHFVPWKDTDFNGAIRKVAGQDLNILSPLVDYISPMCYTHMLKRPPDFVHDIVLNFYDRNATHKILPSIQVSRAYLDSSFSVEEFEIALRSSLEPPSWGVIFWSWEALEKDPEKLEIVKNAITIK